MPDRLPALRALQVFDAAARHLSYSRAAEDLFLTQSAVSHQIKALEAELGTRMFRQGRGDRARRQRSPDAQHQRDTVNRGWLAGAAIVGFLLPPSRYRGQP